MTLIIFCLFFLEIEFANHQLILTRYATYALTRTYISLTQAK